MTRAAGLVLVEFRAVVGAALSARYRGGRWFESTAAHTYSAPFHNTNPNAGPDHACLRYELGTSWRPTLCWEGAASWIES